MDVIGEKFQEALKSFRERPDKKLSQTEAAKLVGLGASRWAQFESGSAIPPPETALELAFLCGMDPVQVSFWALQKRVKMPAYQELQLTDSERFPPQVMDALRKARNQVDVAGVSALRQLRFCVGPLKKLLASGGTLNVAFLDPTSDAFRERREYESQGDGEGLCCEDGEGLTTLRLDFEIRASIEVLKSLWAASETKGWRGKVNVKLYKTLPRASIIIADRMMSYMYAYRPRHTGLRKPVRICWDPTRDEFREVETIFEEIWKNDKNDPVELNKFASSSFVLPLYPVDESETRKVEKDV